MKKFLLTGSLAIATTVAAESSAQTNLPPFAAEWRVTGFVRQGQHEQASMERSGVMSRFVKEGDRLPGDIVVLDVRYEDRSVVLGRGKETAVLHQDTVMQAPPAPAGPLSKQAMPPATVEKNGGQNRKGGVISDKPAAVATATAMQNESGRWVIAFPNGKSLDMQTYVQRYGNVQGAMDHVRELMKNEQDPERLEYRRQQLRALKEMSRAGTR